MHTRSLATNLSRNLYEWNQDPSNQLFVPVDLQIITTWTSLSSLRFLVDFHLIIYIFFKKRNQNFLQDAGEENVSDMIDTTHAVTTKS